MIDLSIVFYLHRPSSIIESFSRGMLCFGFYIWFQGLVIFPGTKTKRQHCVNYAYLYAQWKNSFRQTKCVPLCQKMAVIWRTSMLVYSIGFHCQRDCKERNVRCSLWRRIKWTWKDLLTQTRKRKKQKWNVMKIAPWVATEVKRNMC